jgi:hypothetical protein
MDPISIAIITGIISSVGAAAILGAAGYSPRAMRWVKRWFWGTKFVVLGPPASGKTSFYNFLRHDQFADSFPTRTTLEVTEFNPFLVDKGGDFKLDVSKGFDVPGDLLPQQQAEIAIREAPATLILWTSLTDVNAKEWLASFCLYLNRSLLENRRFAKRLKCLAVVMNKSDEATPVIIDQRRKDFESVVSNTLRPALGDNIDRVSVLTCTLLKSKGGEKAANNVLLTIANSLVKAKRLTRRR